MSDDQDPQSVSRRKFLSTVVLGAGGLIGAALAVPLVGYFLSPLFAKGRGRTIVIANTSEIPVGAPTLVQFEERVRDAWATTSRSRSAWVVTRNGQEFDVFDPHCTHLGCPFYWDDARQIFQCPCHDGRFDIDGKVIAGPPPRALDRLPFSIVNGSIQLTIG